MFSFTDNIAASETSFYKLVGWDYENLYSQFSSSVKGLSPKLSTSVGVLASSIELPSLVIPNPDNNLNVPYISQISENDTTPSIPSITTYYPSLISNLGTRHYRPCKFFPESPKKVGVFGLLHPPFPYSFSVNPKT
ncbi:hypothetical protein AYI68_g1779 [Smittium mucronatum]|uniref:Uncharacterized protein n=1 Tax=Smittium mucronatum TaxID=133383 RepID=A0A1R0H4J5_9FUNG|nr:hypothetical protein AYI68_g1779 [Smittium mucronatum]